MDDTLLRMFSSCVADETLASATLASQTVHGQTLGQVTFVGQVVKKTVPDEQDGSISFAVEYSLHS